MSLTREYLRAKELFDAGFRGPVELTPAQLVADTKNVRDSLLLAGYSPGLAERGIAALNDCPWPMFTVMLREVTPSAGSARGRSTNTILGIFWTDLDAARWVDAHNVALRPDTTVRWRRQERGQEQAGDERGQDWRGIVIRQFQGPAPTFLPELAPTTLSYWIARSSVLTAPPVST